MVITFDVPSLSDEDSREGLVGWVVGGGVGAGVCGFVSPIFSFAGHFFLT
jgi:hypothetical protein